MAEIATFQISLGKWGGREGDQDRCGAQPCSQACLTTGKEKQHPVFLMGKRLPTKTCLRGSQLLPSVRIVETIVQIGSSQGCKLFLPLVRYVPAHPGDSRDSFPPSRGSQGGTRVFLPSAPRQRWAPLDRQPHWRVTLIFLLAKGFCLFKGRTLPACLPLVRASGWDVLLGCPGQGMLCKAGQFSKIRDNLIFRADF